MYDEMTNADLIVVAYEKAHPSDNPSSENADLIVELCSRLKRMEVYRLRIHELSKQVDPPEDRLMNLNSKQPSGSPLASPTCSAWDAWGKKDLAKEIQARMTYFYAQTDGLINFPKSAEGDLLKMVHALLHNTEDSRAKGVG